MLPGSGDDALRDRLIAAALRVFARKGFEGTRILDIVREARLSTGAVYGRFQSKTDLLREAVVSGSRHASRLDIPGLRRVAGERLHDRQQLGWLWWRSHGRHAE